MLVHARALLTSDPRGKTAYLEADLRRPREILADPKLRETLDLSEPVGLLLIAVLHFIRDDDRPRDILGTLVDALAPGSYIAASHATPEYMPPEQAAALRAVMESQWADRPGTDLAALFEHPASSRSRPASSRSPAGGPRTPRPPARRSKTSPATASSSA